MMSRTVLERAIKYAFVLQAYNGPLFQAGLFYITGSMKLKPVFVKASHKQLWGFEKVGFCSESTGMKPLTLINNATLL
jgi:hypothetical protein